MMQDAPLNGLPDPVAGRPARFPKLHSALSCFIGSERATASLEFVICIPLVMMIFMAAFESGLLMTRLIMLEGSVDMVMRNLRLGQYPAPTAQLLKDEICDNSVIMTNCQESISIELQPISTASWDMPTNGTECVDRDQDIKPSVAFNPGAAQQVMLVRVCLVQDALFPTSGMGLKLKSDNKGGYDLINSSAFVNEP